MNNSHECHDHDPHEYEILAEYVVATNEESELVSMLNIYLHSELMKQC